jgi:glycosyltransferase involved in cell wall biosynthesis
MCVYNDAVFTKACLENIEPVVDQIVIVEGSWDGPLGTYDYGENKSSDDGTRRIVEQFEALHPDKVILIDSIGDEECSRNAGLHACTSDWVLHLDSDEFYWPNELEQLKTEIIDQAEAQGADRLHFDEMTFYFNFRNYMKGSKLRMFNSGLGIHYASGNGTGDILVGGVKESVSVPHVSFCHFQWIGDRSKVICSNNIDQERRVQIEGGTDPSKEIPLGGWQWWLSQVYMKFDGTNLDELEKKARGSIHPWSFLHEQHRNNPLVQIKDPAMFPEAVRNSPWFNFKEEGIVPLEADLA